VSAACAADTVIAMRLHGLILIYFFVEVLQDPAVSTRLSDTKAAAEVKALDDFYTMLQNDPNRAFYGFVNSVIVYCMLNGLINPTVIFTARQHSLLC